MMSPDRNIENELCNSKSIVDLVHHINISLIVKKRVIFTVFDALRLFTLKKKRPKPCRYRNFSISPRMNWRRRPKGAPRYSPDD